MRPSVFLVPTLALIALVAACQPDSAADGSRAGGREAAVSTGAEQIQRYRCGDVTVQATFRGSDSATVVINGRTHAMRGDAAASGARYVDGRGNVLWTKGNTEAVLTLQGQPNLECRAGTGAAGAQASGALPDTFRAAGNEPGWLVRVNERGRPGLHIEVDYGQTTYEVPAPTQGPDGWAGTATDGTLVKLSVQRVACQDDMSGETFPARAMLAVGARQLHGCGSFPTGR